MLKRWVAIAMAVVLGTGAALSVAPVQAQERYWQCVPFARMISGIEIFGDAWTWWNQAVGRFRTGNAPELNAVLVFQPHGRMTRGHVAVVTTLVTERVVQVTHANWGGSRGRPEENVTVVDVSPQNDWSQVRVWHNPSGDLGVTVYPTYGFIYGEAADREAAGLTAANS